MCGRTARAAGASASRAPPLHGDAAPLCHVHLHVTSQAAPPCLHRLMHPVYSREYLESVTPQHKPPKKVGARDAALLRWQSARPGMPSGSLPARVVGCPRATISVLLAPAFFGCPPTKLMSAAVPPSVPPRPPTLQLYEKVGYHAVQGLRSAFDLFTGQATRRGWLVVAGRQGEQAARSLFQVSLQQTVANSAMNCAPTAAAPAPPVLQLWRRHE